MSNLSFSVEKRKEIVIDIGSNESISRKIVASPEYINWINEFFDIFHSKTLRTNNNTFMVSDQKQNTKFHYNVSIFKYFVEMLLSKLKEFDSSNQVLNYRGSNFIIPVVLNGRYYSIFSTNTPDVYEITEAMSYDFEYWLNVSSDNK